MGTAKRVLFNTGIIYAKTMITIVIALFSTRLLLATLGAGDFGLFNVIGGLISMLSFLNAAMTVSTQRYISYNIGIGSLEQVRKIFANSVCLHFIIAIILAFIFEVIGVYFLNYKLNIDHDRLVTANVVFQFVVVSSFITIVSVPYDALINAHENMTFLAIVGIFESVLKLFIALYLFIALQDKLLVYGFLIMLSTIAIRIIKRIYVRKKYHESHVHYRKEFDKVMIKELSAFAGWNLFGSFSYIARNEGMAILLNLFFTTVVNAAFGIANQVASQLSFFCSAMLQALNPQIMKSEGAKDRARMFHLSMIACRLGFLLLSIVAIPCILEMPSILQVWLKTVPQYTVEFCSLILIAAMINQLTVGLDSAIQATGSIRNYMLIAGTIKLLIVPAAYVLLKLKVNVTIVFMLYSILEGLGGMVRVYILHKQAGLSVSKYFNEVLLRVLPVTLIVVIIDLFIVKTMDFRFRWLFLVLTSMVIFSLVAYFLSFSKKERTMINGFMVTIFQKMKLLPI